MFGVNNPADGIYTGDFEIERSGGLLREGNTVAITCMIRLSNHPQFAHIKNYALNS